MPHYRNETKEAQHILGDVVEPGDTVEATKDAAKSLDASPYWTKVAAAAKAAPKAETPAKSDLSDEPDAVKAADPKEKN